MLESAEKFSESAMLYKEHFYINYRPITCYNCSSVLVEVTVSC